MHCPLGFSLLTARLRARAGDFLAPDEVTFAVLLRGYGSKSPPDWVRMDTVLTTMRTKYGLEPTASERRCLLGVGMGGARMHACMRARARAHTHTRAHIHMHTVNTCAHSHTQTHTSIRTH